MKFRIFQWLLVLSAFAVSIWLYPQLPVSIPSHWNIRGEIDGYSSRLFGAFLIPVLLLAMQLLYMFIPQFDPYKEKYALFENEWRIIQGVISLFFWYLHIVILKASQTTSMDITPYMFAGMGSLFIVLGNYMSKIRQNFFVGIKTPWTITNEENWNKTHRLASWTITFGGIAVLTQPLWHVPAEIVFIILMASFILPVVYSFMLFKHWDKYFLIK